MARSTPERWTNWGGTASCAPARVVSPRTEEELIAAVRTAAEQGQPVKVIGAGHSFTDIACTPGTQIRLDRYQLVLAVDRAAHTITVQAGITMAQVGAALAPFGLALENMGDVAYQSISGAISTATHGTGERFRNVSSQVVGLRLVLGDGSTLDCSADHEAEVLAVARVGLGALGVLSTVTLRVVPAYFLHSLQEPLRLEEVLETLDERTQSADHFEFFYWPHTELAQTITNRRLEEPPAGLARRAGVRHYVNDILVENHAFGLIQQAAWLHPDWIPRLADFTARTMTKKELVDRSDRVYANERLVRFAEMEYALPREHLAATVREIRDMLRRTGHRISFPIEVRTVAADDIPLSPAYGRLTGYIAVHVFHRFDYRPYFREVEAIMNQVAGRPHWGKLHFQSADTLRPRYPEWDRFLAVRDHLDPERRFGNAYLDRVLGTS